MGFSKTRGAGAAGQVGAAAAGGRARDAGLLAQEQAQAAAEESAFVFRPAQLAGSGEFELEGRKREKAGRRGALPAGRKRNFHKMEIHKKTRGEFPAYRIR